MCTGAPVWAREGQGQQCAGALGRKRGTSTSTLDPLQSQSAFCSALGGSVWGVKNRGGTTRVGVTAGAYGVQEQWEGCAQLDHNQGEDRFGCRAALGAGAAWGVHWVPAAQGAPAESPGPPLPQS